MCATRGWGRQPPCCSKAPLLLVLRCLAQVLATGFHRFLARFSGRRRPFHQKSPPWTILALVVVSSLFSIVDACSSRTTPKPRPPVPTARPNITFHTYACPPAYAAWYCLNEATCFTVKIRDSLLYNCECADGFMGPRCEYKDLDGSYLPSQRRILLETASIAGGATIAVLFVFILCVMAYVHYKNKMKSGLDCVDGVVWRPGLLPPRTNSNQSQQRIFGTKWRTNNPNPHGDIAAVHDSLTVQLQHQQQPPHQQPHDKNSSRIEFYL
ncbi:PREDICTED: uncharacterized protein LOC108563430 isoform X2 [Nicrophorus vespilloides]|nr:PREDICTED: uncharacterized protein LOC108563430 isoform X2 [Nicrophorus vespilloides]